MILLCFVGESRTLACGKKAKKETHLDFVHSLFQTVHDMFHVLH